jgi:hypothetical protein
MGIGKIDDAALAVKWLGTKSGSEGLDGMTQ